MKHRLLALNTFVMVVVALFWLSACGTASTTVPLAEGQPTLLFFYTDN